MLGVEIANITVRSTDTYHINALQRRTVGLGVGEPGPDRPNGLRIDLMVAVAGITALSLAGYSADDARKIKHHSDRDIALGCAAYLARIEAGLPMLPTDEEIRECEPGNPLYDLAMVIIDRAEASLCAPPTGESECEQNRAVPAETVRLIPVLKAGADVAKEVKPVIQIVDGTQPEAGAGWGSGGWRLVEQFQANLQIRREFARQHPTGHARIFRAFGVELATTAAERGPVVA